MTTEKTSPASAPLAYSLAELASVSNISRGQLYKEIEAGRLETRKLGRRRIVTADAARRWLEGLPKS